MPPQITRAEFIRLVVALLAACAIYIAASMIGSIFLADRAGMSALLAFLFYERFLPALVAILLATLIPPWRYKLIAATLMLSGITVWGVVQAAFAAVDFSLFGNSLVRLSALMTGALLAVYSWRQVKRRRDRRRSPTPSPFDAATAMPTTSPLVMGLALLLIPLSYITIVSSTFLVLGYSTLLFMALFAVDFPMFQFSLAYLLIPLASIAALAAIWASFRALLGLLWHRAPRHRAVSVPWRSRPHLKAMIEEVCRAMETRPPDNVILEISPVFYVTQHKIRTFDKVVRGRTLAIGMPLLPLMTRQELKATLVHEFAHFSGSDTVYTSWVAPVYRSLGESITRLEHSIEGMSNGVYALLVFLLYPALITLMIYYETFAAIDNIISRSNEFRADWIAASHYGRDAVISGLMKSVQYGSYFSSQQAYVVGLAAKDIRFHYRLVVPLRAETLQGYWDEALKVPPHEFDSHPPLSLRIANLPVTNPPQPAGYPVGNAAPVAFEIVEMKTPELHIETSNGEASQIEGIGVEQIRNEVIQKEDDTTAALQQELDEEISRLIASYEKMIIDFQASLPNYI
jgi:Zn-dependent protease with chaperone function